MQQQNWPELIEDQMARHPSMDARDVYKLLYQGVMGPEHLIASAEGFTACLQEEYDLLPAGGVEPLWEAIRPDGRLGRVNLRPYKAQGRDLSWLVGACLETARRPWGTVEELRVVWAWFSEACHGGRWGQFPASEVRTFTVWLEEHGYPAVHHSAGYMEAERPAYRLLAGDLLSGT